MAVRRTRTALANVSLMVSAVTSRIRFLLPAFSSFGNDIVQLGEIRAVYAQHDACRGGDLVHGREVILVGAVEDGLVVLDGLNSRLGGVDVLGVDDDGAVADALLPSSQSSTKLRAVACVMDEDASLPYSRSPMRS